MPVYIKSLIYTLSDIVCWFDFAFQYLGGHIAQRDHTQYITGRNQQHIIYIDIQCVNTSMYTNYTVHTYYVHVMYTLCNL